VARRVAQVLELLELVGGAVIFGGGHPARA
jgi:hypothetical protein